MARIRPKKWDSFQHYKDRSPSWIKLHKNLLDDYDFQCLPLASRALAPMLWLVASEDKDGWIDANEKKLAFRLRVDEHELRGALKALIEAGFFDVEQDASVTLAEVERAASPEKENKKQVQTEKITSSLRSDVCPSANATDEITLAVEAFNEVASEVGWPLAQKITAARRSALKARLTDSGGLDGWRAAMAKARASPFLRGEAGRDRAHEKWVPDLDFFLQQSSFLKLMEGKYDDRPAATGDRNSDIILGIGRAVARYAEPAN